MKFISEEKKMIGFKVIEIYHGYNIDDIIWAMEHDSVFKESTVNSSYFYLRDSQFGYTVAYCKIDWDSCDHAHQFIVIKDE